MPGKHVLAVTGALLVTFAFAPATALADDCGMDLTDASGGVWDVFSNGAVGDVSGSQDDPYDVYGDLYISTDGGANEAGYDPNDSDACTYEDGGREIVYPTLRLEGVDVSRKFFVPAGAPAFGRWLEVITNPGPGPVTVRMRFRGGLGTDSDTVILATSDGNRAVEPGDAWGVFHEEDLEDSVIASMWDSAAPVSDRADAFPDGPAPGVDRVNIVYDDIVLAAGETAIYLHADQVTLSRDDAIAFARAQQGGSEDLYAGLSDAERSLLRNWPQRTDSDADGVRDDADNCPEAPNPDQRDTDADGRGDACDADDDDDGRSDEAERLFGTDPVNPDTDGDGVLDGADDCPTTEGDLGNGCPSGRDDQQPTEPSSAPSQPAPQPQTQLVPVPVFITQQGDGFGPRFPAKLQVRRAEVDRGDRVLDLLAPITRRAQGTVDVAFRAAGLTTSTGAPIDSENGRVSLRGRIEPEQARLGTGIVTLTYGGSETVRPQQVRLRAARNPANLEVERPVIAQGRLRTSGTLNERATGIVRTVVEFFSNGRTQVFEARDTIEDGAFSIDVAIPAEVAELLAQRRGTVHSYTTFTGNFGERIRGEMQAYEVNAQP